MPEAKCFAAVSAGTSERVDRIVCFAARNTAKHRVRLVIAQADSRLCRGGSSRRRQTMTCGIRLVSAEHVEIIECFAASGAWPRLAFRLTGWQQMLFVCFGRLREVRVSPRVLAKHVEIIECFVVWVFHRNTPSLSHWKHTVFPCFKCVSPIGERRRETHAAPPSLGKACR
jgi:hypothetical protein